MNVMFKKELIMSKTKFQEIIRKHGGSTALANRLGCSPQVINNWRNRGVPPAAILKFPDIFHELMPSARCKHELSKPNKSSTNRAET